MMAKANPLFIGAYETLTLLLWFLFGKKLIELNGAVGATQAFALYYAVYAVIVITATVYVVRKVADSTSALRRLDRGRRRFLPAPR